MKIMTHFWQQYVSGALSSLSAFIEAARVQRTAHNAPDTSYDRFIGTMKDGVFFDAPKRLKFPSLMTSEMVLRQHDRADYQHTDQRMMLFGATLIELCRKQGIPMYVHSAFRTKDQQNELRRKGVSQLVWPNAPHCQGKALDIVHSKYHWDLTNQEWVMIGKIGKDLAYRMGLDVRWGGDWNSNDIPVFQDSKEHFWDPAHWELADWKRSILKPIPGEPLRLTPRAILKRM